MPGNLGLACAELGHFRRAIDYYQQHLETVGEIGDRGADELKSATDLRWAGPISSASKVRNISAGLERELGHADTQQVAAAVEDLRARQSGVGGE